MWHIEFKWETTASSNDNANQDYTKLKLHSKQTVPIQDFNKY